jgi:hypothetical protein
LSSADGAYTAPSLAPGAYRVDIELAGFKRIRREGIRLSTGEKAGSTSSSSWEGFRNR